MRLIFMGTPTFAIPVLAGLTNISDSEVVAVFTTPDRAAGRGRKPELPIKDYAAELGIQVKQPETFRSDEVRAELTALQPDAIIVAAYGKLLPKPVLDVPKMGCLNIHPSLLPRHRGPSPVATTILNRDGVTGLPSCCWMKGGHRTPHRTARIFPARRREYRRLTKALFELGARLLVETIPKWESGEIPNRKPGRIPSQC
ncbi:MAG: hypothetical protein CM1200mP27_02660 [Chloroflexota bacterium]|nr:MAG: hypothetical protein CM1200mP27_02660 [Chloroflexota bacterium]